MAVYKLFPKKDNFIYSYYANDNYGRDEVLEISSDETYIARALMEFDSSEISSLVTSSNNVYKSILKMYLSEANNLPEQYSIQVYPLLDNWEMGTGRTKDIPNPRNGSCWNYPDYTNTNITWSNFELVSSSYKLSQSFEYNNNKDINCDITTIVSGWEGGDITNNGLLIKHTSTNESSSTISTEFFSIDTHTIYSPTLDFYWDDISYTSSLTQISSDKFISKIINNKGEYYSSDIIKFRINNNDLYPTRAFQTSSVYLNKKVLPSSSYWALKDTRTNEFVINYDSLGTKIGADNEGNYFNIYMNGLQPQRYYQIIYKTIVNNETITIESPQHIFKIIQ